VDIYSYGIILYAIVHGSAPWKNENLAPLQVRKKKMAGKKISLGKR
jgi:serine/threonine protein kinase